MYEEKPDKRGEGQQGNQLVDLSLCMRRSQTREGRGNKASIEILLPHCSSKKCNQNNRSDRQTSGSNQLSFLGPHDLGRCEREGGTCEACCCTAAERAGCGGGAAYNDPPLEGEAPPWSAEEGAAGDSEAANACCLPAGVVPEPPPPPRDELGGRLLAEPATCG